MQWPQCATPPFMNHATPCNTLQYLAIPCYILLYSAIPCNTLQYHPACTSSIPAAFSLAILKWLPRQFLPLLLFTPFSPAAASLPFIMFSRIIRHISRAAVFIPSAARFKWFPARYNHSVSQCLPLFPINWQWRPLSICRYHYFSNDSYRVVRFMSSSSSSSSEKQDNLSTRSQHSLVRFSEIGMANLWVGEPD